MNDHESVIMNQLREKLIAENERLSKELFRRKPFREKIIVYGFQVLLILGMINVVLSVYGFIQFYSSR